MRLGNSGRDLTPLPTREKIHLRDSILGNGSPVADNADRLKEWLAFVFLSVESPLAIEVFSSGLRH
jgi:hypothetical protein